jgi:methylphosphotriester-DNA--protein-cysteine methyltransferase
MRGEKYVYTVAEAEKAGFRRARKWRPDQKTAHSWPWPRAERLRRIAGTLSRSGLGMDLIDASGQKKR